MNLLFVVPFLLRTCKDFPFLRGEPENFRFWRYGFYVNAEKTQGGKPVKPEQGKGGIILLYSCDGHSARNSMRRETLFLHSGIGRKRGDGIPLPGRGCFFCRMKKPGSRGREPARKNELINTEKSGSQVERLMYYPGRFLNIGFVHHHGNLDFRGGNHAGLDVGIRQGLESGGSHA